MTHNITMPDLGQTTAEVKILRWFKKPGDRLLKGEPLMEVETDKVTMEVEAYLKGYIRELLVEEGQMVRAANTIAIVTDSPEELYERALPAPSALSPRLAPTSSLPFTEPKEEGLGILAAPAARTKARALGINLASVIGTGPEGLITRKDVERQSANPSGATAKPMAATAALTSRSKQTIPHFYVAAEVDVSAAERWRDEWNNAHPDLPSTANDVFVRAASMALRHVNGMNVGFESGNYAQRSAADVLLIVATQLSTLTLVPLADPGAPPWNEYLRTIRTVLANAKQGRLGESRTLATPLLAISNLGMHGVKEFTAIIPPGCTAVLAIGSVRDAAVVLDGRIQIGRVCSITLSADHRVIDGITAAKFLKKIQEHLNAL